MIMSQEELLLIILEIKINYNYFLSIAAYDESGNESRENIMENYDNIDFELYKKEIEYFRQIMKNVMEDLEILEQCENIDVIKMNLRNIIFHLKYEVDKNDRRNE